MKYTINSDTISIEYIANGKRKQLILKNDDNVDMDFFNQLMKAKSNKRDAMCELFQRKILKVDDEDTVHIQPLKLDKELKPSKYAEKIELNRRKEELEHDKNGIKDEINVLVKLDAKNKDVKTLNKDDLNDEHDEDKLKELQRKYMEIDKIHQMIVNQLDSLEINTADSVKIKELKNLTVNAFDSINKSLVDAKITEQDKEDIANKISNVVVPRYNNLKSLLKQLNKQIKQVDTTSKAQYDDFKLQYTSDFMDLIKAIEETIKTLPLTEDVQQIIKLIEDLQGEENIPKLEQKLNELTDKIDNLPNVFNKQTIQQREITLEELVDKLKKEQDILDQNISPELINAIKANLPNIDPSINYNDFLEKIFKEHYQGTVKWESFKPSTIETFKDLAFWNNDYLYAINQYSLPINGDPIQITNMNVHFYRYSFDKIKNIKVKDLIDNVTLQQKDATIIHHNPNIYIKTEIGKYPRRYYGHYTTNIPVFVIFIGDKDFTELLKAIQKNTPKAKGLDDNGGRIMIDLKKSTTDEKLNEIIKLLSQINYNIFTTTPMYKNNGYTQSSKNQNQKKSKGIDLYDILDL